VVAQVSTPPPIPAVGAADTLYPALDRVNWRLGGADALQELAQAAAETYNTTISYHINVDEGYAFFNGSANPEFDLAACRVNVDHATPWYQNMTLQGSQYPDPRLRCSLSKTTDAVGHGRYARINRMLSAAPVSRTLHTDAWRNNDVSYTQVNESTGWGWISEEEEMACGCEADVANFAAAGVSLGCEGQNGMAAELMGLMSYFWHGGVYDVSTWGKIVSGTNMGLDDDCYGPDGTDGNGLYGFEAIADRFYPETKVSGP